MSETDESVMDESTEIESTDEPDVEVEEQEPVEDPDSGLKKALAAERKRARELERRAKALEQQLSDKDKPAEEQAIEAARREAREQAIAEANERVKRSELKAAAAGKVKRPDLLLKVADLDSIEVSESGDVDSDAISEAIDAFLEEYPELAVSGNKFSGSADQGAKGRQSGAAQLTQQDIDKMTPEQIDKARKEGLLNRLMGVS